MEIPQETRGVWWWVLDRDGKLIDPELQPPRVAKSPPYKDGSPYTPNFLEEDGSLPQAHLHLSEKRDRIVGIHGEADLSHLRLTLQLCLNREQKILGALAHSHYFPLILLRDVLRLLQP